MIVFAVLLARIDTCDTHTVTTSGADDSAMKYRGCA